MEIRIFLSGCNFGYRIDPNFSKTAIQNMSFQINGPHQENMSLQ